MGTTVGISIRSPLNKDEEPNISLTNQSKNKKNAGT